MASKSFQVSIDFIGNIGDLQSKIKQVSGEIGKIGATTGGAQVQKQFEQLVKTVTDLQTRASQPISSKAEFNKLAGEVSKANMSYGQLMGTIERLQSLGGAKLLEFLPKDQQNNIKQATQAVKEFEEAKEKAEKNQGKNVAYSKLAGEAKFAQQEVEQLKKKLDEANAAKDKVFGSKASNGKAAKTTRDEYNQLNEQVRALERQRAELGTSKGLKQAVAAAPQGSEAQAQAEAALAKYKELSNEISKINGQLNQSAGGQLIKNAETAQKEYNKAAKQAAILQEQLKNTKIPEDGSEKLKAAFDQLVTKAAQLGVQVNDIGSVDNVQTLLNRLNQLESDGFIEGAQAAQQYANSVRSVLDPAFKQMESGMQGVNQSWGQFMTAQEDMSMLQNRLKYFFSLTNSIQLLKRTVTNAMGTVKELDAVMTETAVVTDFTVGDMWDKLPEYAEQASALGASIKDLYSATTLYYQQGLNSEQAMGVGVETMKMARIAGMDASEATQAMTAALRGFNMEINEDSATRVNDVYSKLAAITASDTEQIATAMSKTASIADSANMEFETTAAFLAQIIETTQEAPETAGTAMKTIIARFTEVKKLFDEGMLSGEDSEGEAIEINKIDAALRTVGISLTDFLNGKKGIDDIFLELASKWDTLDLATQRYIATTAAGSRQQSRFIAMMSNYDRTMELVTAANNSAGASQEQFDKTLDSMEAKLQQLQNAWNQFTMGIANSDVIKGGVDLLTGLLETVNKLIDALSGGSGASKGVLSLMTVVGALSGGKMLLQKGFGTIGTWMGVNQGISQQKGANAFQRAGQYARQGSSFKNKTGRYFTGLFSKEADEDTTIFNKKIKQLHQEAKDEEEAIRTLSPKAYKAVKEYVPEQEQSIQELQAIQKEFQKTGQVSAESAEKLKQYGLTVQDVANSVYPLQVNLQAIGAAATIAGGALGLLANVGAKQGWSEELVSGLQTASAALTGLGGILMMLPMVMGNIRIQAGKTGLALVKMGADGAIAGTVASAGWAPFLLTIGVVIVAVIALVAAFKAIHAASPEGKLEAAAEVTNNTAEAAENAARAYEHLASALDSVAEKSGAIKGLAADTSEFKKAASELNEEVSGLVEQYPELSKYVDSSKGYLTFKEDENSQQEINKILSDYQDNSVKAQSASAAAKLQKQQAQRNVDFQNLNYEAKQYTTRDMTVSEMGTMTGADAPAGQIGAMIGGMIAQAFGKGPKIEEANQETTDEIARAIANGEYNKYMNDDGTFQEGSKFAYLESKDSEAFASLKSYGEGLIADDAAAKVFTDSLLSNATMISDVSEDQKSNMMNFFNSNQAKSLLETEKTNLKEMDEANWEKQKEAYAKAMGYTYSDGNIYKGEAIAANKLDLSKDSLIEQIAGMNVTDSISNTMDKLAPKLSQMDASQAKLVSAFSSQNLDNLTIGEINSLEDKTIESIAADLGYTEKDGKSAAQQYAEDLGYSDIETFESDVADFQSKAQDQKESIVGQFEELTGQENWVDENLADASYSFLNNLKGQASQMAPDTAKEYLKSFVETVKNEDLSGQEQEALQSYLSNIDWSNMTQAINAMDYMQQMGMDSSAIKDFWNIATDGANTYMSSVSQVSALTEKFQGKIKQVNEVEETLADGKATNEQMQQLISAGVDVSNFELTADGWKATKEQIEEATRKLREYNAEQARAAAKQQAKEFEEARKNSKDGILYNKKTGKYSIDESFLEKTGLSGAYSVDTEGKLVAGTVTADNASGLATLFGINEAAYEGNVEAFHQAVQAALLNYINLLNNGEQIQIMADKAAALAEAAVYTTDENVQRGGSAESVRISMQQEASDKGLDVEEVTKYAEALVNVQGIESKVASQIAIDYAQMAQGMEEVNSKWDEWQAKLAKPNEMEKAVALNEMAEAANKMLGVAGALDAEFLKLEGSMELVEQAAKGDANAFNQLQKAAARSGLEKLRKDLPKDAKNFEKVNKALDQTTELAEDLADTEVNVGETFKVDPNSIDVNSIAGQLTQLYNNAYAAALEGGASVAEAQNAANAAIEAAGYEAPEMVAQTVTVTGAAPDSEIPNISITDVPGVGPVGSVQYTTAEGPETSHQVTQFVPAGSGGFTKKAETVNAGGGKGGGGGGGGGSKPWENSIDKLYNVQENIDRTTREREKIERRYQRLIDRRLATAQELQRASQAEIESLKEQAKYQQQMVDGRKEMLLDEMAENSELEEYATVNVETGQITIDWELINSVTDEEEGSAIEEYLSKLEELRDSMHEAQDALEDINDTVWEIEERGREEYMEFEDRIKEALVEVRQKEIDALEEINESINDTNTKLLDSIQQSVDKMRQDRENERTEEDLQEKQRQLAYLEQDTSGANAMEILELQEEIRQGQEDYTDALIDQKISELQEQNDAAAEQREKQITLLQNQLDWTIESGRIWAEVDELLKNGLDPQGGLIRGSKLEQILKSGENWVGLSSVGQMDWLLDLETLVAQSMNWQMTKGQLENLHESVSGQEISFKNAKGETVTGKVDSSGRVWTGEDTYYKDVYKWIDGTYHTTESSATKYAEPKPTSSGGGSSGGSSKSGGGKQYPYHVPGVPGAYSTPEEAGAAAIKYAQNNNTKIDSSVQNYTSNGKKVADVYADPKNNSYSVKKYKTGGLADFTGPAWLDGTKSRPELVLNQRDTQNFIQLKDILSSIMSRNFSNTSTATENNGDITYDIDINVETMGSDYDVEQVANKVKSMINEDARYRNNNAISLKR